MALTLRLLSDSDVPELQRIYDASPRYFERVMRAPAPPNQAARDFIEALQSPGRFQFGVRYDAGTDDAAARPGAADALIGVADCRLDDEEEGLARIGMILLAPPFDDPAIVGLVARMLERWLAAEYGARRVEALALAHVPADLAFWEAQGYALTGAQFRRELPGYAPRYLVLGKALA